MSPPTYEGLARLLFEANFFDQPDAKDLKLEQPTRQQLRLEFTRKSKKTSTDGGGNTQNTRRKRRKKGKPKVDSRDENKENLAAAPRKSDASFLQEWRNDEVEIADYRSSDDSQDEQLVEWYQNLKGNKARDPNLLPAIGNTGKVGPVIRHESSDEEKSWLQKDIADTYVLDMMAKYPTGENPGEIVFEDLLEPRRWIERTHHIAENAMLMNRNRIFTILRQNRPLNLLAHLRLGYCITHNPGQPVCQQDGRTCALQCHICGVCCHMYSCTCRLVKRFNWCSHIHAAVHCGGNKFKGDQQVFLHTSSRYTQLAHLRATCFDMVNDVKPVPSNANAFDVNGWTTEWTPQSVFRSSQKELCHLCPQYKRCPECCACRHQYLCACAEFMVQKRLCEHCHVVAIFVSQNRISMLSKREFRYLSDVSDDTDEEADPKRDISPIMLPLRKLFAHHQKSYSIPFRRIQIGLANNEHVYFVRRCDPERRFVVHSKNRGQCACAEDLTSLLDCSDCKICRHYLTCNCGKDDVELCKHTHAVRRYIVRNSTPADSNIESALESMVKRALSNFREGCDTAEIDCGPLLATDKNINAVVANLKSLLGQDVEVEFRKVDEVSFSREYNSIHVPDKVGQVFDPKVEGCEKMHPEVVSCTTPNSDSLKNDAQICKPVSERNDNSDSIAVVDGVIESATEINGGSFLSCGSTESVCYLDPVLIESSVDDLDVAIPVEKERLNLNSNVEEKSEHSLRPVLKLSCNEDSLQAGELSMMKENSEFDRRSVCYLDPVLIESLVDDFDVAIPVETERLNLNSVAEEKSGYSLKPVLELSCNEDSLQAGESSTMEENSEFDRQLLLVQSTDYVGTNGSRASVNESQAKLPQINYLNWESTLEHSVDTEMNAAEEIGKTAEINSSTNLDVAGNSQVSYLLKNDGHVDTSKVVEDAVAVETSQNRFLNDNFAGTGIEGPLFQGDDSSDEGVCEEYEENFFAPSDFSSVKTLRSFYDLQFEPVMEIRYKANADSSGEECPKVLAESRRCIVTISDSKQSSLLSKAILRQDSLRGGKTVEKDKHCVLRETSQPSCVSENFKLCSIGEGASSINPALPKDHLYGFSKEDDDNRVSIETGGSSLGVKVVEQNLPKDSVIFWEPVYIEDLPGSSGIEKKDRRKVSTEACAPRVLGEDVKKNCMEVNDTPDTESLFLDFEQTSSDFDMVDEDEYLISKECSKSTRSETFKQRSLNLIRKLNPVKYFKDQQKTSPPPFFGNRNWSRSRRQRELAVLESVADDCSVTDTIYYV